MKKYRGSVSLFAAAIFLVLVSLIVTTVLSARIEGARVMVKTASSMALDSLLSGYDKDLFSEFGILLLDGRMGGESLDRDKTAAKITEYMSYNIDAGKGLSFAGNTDLYGIELYGVAVEEALTAVDCGGLLWFTEAVDYEKYAKPIDLAAEYLGLESADEETRAVNEINDGIVACSQAILTITDTIKKIVGMTDGVDCSAGIDFENIKNVSPNYVKQFVTTEVTPENIGVRDSRIYRHISFECVNEFSLLQQAKSYYDSEEIPKAENILSDIRDAAKSVMKCEEDIISLINGVDTSQKILDRSIDSLDMYISSKSDVISDDVLAGIGEDAGRLKNYKQELSEEICDVMVFKTVLEADRVLLDQIIHIIDVTDLSADRNTAMDNFDRIEKCMNEYSIDELTVNYEHLGESTEDTSVLDTVRAFLDDGIIGLVMPADRTISMKNIYKISGLASTVCNTDSADTLEAGGNLDSAGKKIVYSEYVMDHFYSFADNRDDRQLSYEAEYILSGKKSDNENLTDAVLKLAALRSGPNMLYIMSDSEKKDEAYALASALVGFTGIDAAVRIVQYAIMYMWSYAEGLSDVKILLKGDKVPLKKTEETWHLSLENLLSCSINDAKGTDKGLDYESYLKFMIYLENNGKKSAYTMDLAELRMEQKGHAGFRLKNYIYGLGIKGSYKLNGLEYCFTFQDVCKY